MGMNVGMVNICTNICKGMVNICTYTLEDFYFGGKMFFRVD